MFAALICLIALIVLPQSSSQQNQVADTSEPSGWVLARILIPQEVLQNYQDEIREKRRPLDLDSTDASKRTSLKRLAILSARGFGRR